MTDRTTATCDVLLVEDDRDIRATISEILEDEGYLVATAASGQEALDQLNAATTPRLILLDLMMPGMNGWEFQAQLRQIPDLAALPVVILSGGRDLVKHAASFNVADYLEKPVNLTQLLDTVEKYCQPVGA